MIERLATCRCEQLQVRCTGEPVRVSVCHCLECQKRSGSAFSAQARWPEDQVRMTGAYREWSKIGDSGGRGTFRFCPECSATLAYVIDRMPGLVAIPIGAFADPHFPAPAFSVYEARRHGWVAITGDDVEHYE